MKRYTTVMGSGLLSITLGGLLFGSDAFCSDVRSRAPAILSAINPAAYQTVQTESLAQIRGNALEPAVMPPLEAPSELVADPTPVVEEPQPEPTPPAVVEPQPEPRPVAVEPSLPDITLPSVIPLAPLATFNLAFEAHA